MTRTSRVLLRDRPTPLAMMVQRRRVEKQVTIRQLAKRSGVSIGTIVNFERHGKSVRWSTLERILLALDLRLVGLPGHLEIASLAYGRARTRRPRFQYLPSVSWWRAMSARER